MPSLADLEHTAQLMAWSNDRCLHGYAFAETSQGRLRITHLKGPEPKRGQRIYALNTVTISRARAQSLVEGA